MYRGLRLAGYVVGGLGLAVLAVVGAARLLRTYHTYSSSAGDLPLSALGGRNPSFMEHTLMTAVSQYGWPLDDTVLFGTKDETPYLVFDIQGSRVRIEFMEDKPDFAIINPDSPAQDLSVDTNPHYTDIVAKLDAA